MTKTDLRHRDVAEAAASQPMLQQVERWSAINSGSANLAGLATMAGLLADAFSALPGELALLDGAPSERVSASGQVLETLHGRHLRLRVRPDASRRMLFTGHMDTVYPADHSFQSISPIMDGRLNGPGVADMKGGLAVLLAALSAIERSGAAGSIGYDVLINSDEEVGSPSSAALLADLAPTKIAALTYEPALPDGTLAGARGGSGNFSILVRGRSAHAGRNPADGRNAVVAAADLTLRLAGVASPGLSVNPAKIDGGGPNNVVPDTAVLRVNFRPAGEEDVRHARTAVEAAAASVARDHDVAVEVHGGFGRPPKPVDPAAEKLFALVRECGRMIDLDVRWRSTGGVCDGNNIAACGVPVVDTMGVRGGAIHSPDEYLIVESLAERAMLSALAICRIADGGLA
ncbi:glutamate carboxypeptidase [Sphingomonas jejuensis]|uniref:Glutamate carboxypeptidase n=1 Tax=Sphingomonas jejuensis TaxID=904715 RepID=A0ABX0XJU5_9SPHN|nr:hydrolase [Sphingomonas jejuensis]NJC33614.1 glutamate carboxypeptidase [Sphingomonas jejuensis]